VLPTESRYKNLADEQIDVLLQYHLMMPSDEELRELYRRSLQVKDAVDSFPEEELRRNGYPEEVIAQMKRDLPKSVS
jgi:hypothetical protein